MIAEKRREFKHYDNNESIYKNQCTDMRFFVPSPCFVSMDAVIMRLLRKPPHNARALGRIPRRDSAGVPR